MFQSVAVISARSASAFRRMILTLITANLSMVSGMMLLVVGDHHHSTIFESVLVILSIISDERRNRSGQFGHRQVERIYGREACRSASTGTTFNDPTQEPVNGLKQGLARQSAFNQILSRFMIAGIEARLTDGPLGPCAQPAS